MRWRCLSFSVLATVEKKGVLLNTQLLAAMSAEIEQLMSLTEEKIYQLAGRTIQYQFAETTPGGFSSISSVSREGGKRKTDTRTDIEVLSNLARSHELPAEILSYRTMAKLRSTYIDALPLLINPETGRIHTSYNQTVTATGRLSSSNPNLQNTPSDTEGKRIRQAFHRTGRMGNRLRRLLPDSNFRILAHLSATKALTTPFMETLISMQQTAANVFAVFPEMVTAERDGGQGHHFGILYGMERLRLSEELNVQQKTAQVYIDEYFNKYPR